jgi:ribonuclease P protein subunit RPR2
MKHRNKSEEKKIALDRIKILFQEAESVFDRDKFLANRYVALARKISMKVKIRFSRELKRKFCKHCYSYLVPGKNCRVRVRLGKVIIYCMECKMFARIPVRKNKIIRNLKTEQ